MPRVMSYNIRYGGVGKQQELAEVIKRVDPDVVLLQEATHPDVVAHLAEFAGFPHHASRHAYPLHSTIEGAHCARSWLWTVARRSIVGRPGKIKAIEELGSGKRRGRQKKSSTCWLRV